MKRRDVLKAGVALGALVNMPIARAKSLNFNFGVQLSTLTPQLMGDFEGTLAKVAEIGYRQVEFSALGLLGRPAEYVAELLDKNGLTAPVGRAAPAFPENFAELSREEVMKFFRTRGHPDHLLENLKQGIRDAEVLGQKFINLPALMPDRFQTMDQVKANIDLINQAGDLCAESGIQFGYHNHDWELKPIGDEIPYVRMLEETDPEKVGFQLDTYWIVKGGGDLLHYLSNYPGRFTTCHLKDIDDEGVFADVGSGNIDFPAFIQQALASGTQYFFVERDGPPNPVQSVTNSYRYLSGL